MGGEEEEEEEEFIRIRDCFFFIYILVLYLGPRPIPYSPGYKPRSSRYSRLFFFIYVKGLGDVHS